MEYGGGKHVIGNTAKRVVMLLGTTALVIVAVAMITQRLSLGEEQLAVSGAIVLFFISAFACFVFCGDKKGGRVLLRGILYGVSCTVILLMVGFMCDSDRVSASGVLRVTVSCLGGSLFGFWLGSKRKEGRRDRRLKRFRA